MLGFNKKSKIVGDKILTKVINGIQCKLMDLGDVTYDIKRELRPTEAYSKDGGFFGLFFGWFFHEKPAEEHLIVILYDRDNCQKCVWTSIDMDAVLRLASNDIEFVVKEFIDPTALKLRREFEALKAEQDANP